MDHVLTTKKSFYLKSNQRSMDVNYKYQDWEPKSPGVYYDYDLKTTKSTTELKEVTIQTNTETTAVTTTEVTTLSIETTAATETTVPTATTVPTVTTTQTKTTKGTISVIHNYTDTATTETTTLTSEIIDEGIQEINDTVPETNSSYTTLEITDLLTNTLPADATLEDLLHWFASTSPDEYTTLIPPPPTINVLSLMPHETEDNVLDHLDPWTTTTKNPILEEIKDEINKTNDYFASSVRELVIVLSHKNSSHVDTLLMDLNSRLASAMEKNTLAMFSGLMIGAFQALLQMLMLATDDVRQEYFNYAIYALENRHTAFASDINAVFDVVETIYTDKDVAEISDIIKKVEAYPNITEDSDTLIGELIEAYILKPHANIVGTAKEKLLLMELHTALEDRLFPGHDLGRRFGKERKENISAKFKSITKTVKHNLISRKYLKRIDKIQKTTKLPKYKNDQKQRARNVKKIKSKEQRKKERRLVEKERKIIRASSNSRESSLQSISSTSSESEETQDSDIVRYKLESAYSHSRETKRKRLQNKAMRYKAHSKQIKTKPNRYRKLTTPNDEEMLKIRLKDALLHTTKLRRFGHKLDRLTKKDSYSDDEAILKSKIYKVFGFNHDIKHNYQRSLYLRNGKIWNVERFNAKGVGGYDYKDWEAKSPDLYDYILPKTNSTVVTEHTNATETPTTEETETTNSTTETQSVESTETTVTTDIYHVVTTLTISLPLTPPTTSTTESTTEVTPTNEIPSLFASDGFVFQHPSDTTATSETSIFVDPIKAKIRSEILESKKKLRAGYFTSSAYVLLKIIDRKRDEDIGNLLQGLDGEIIRLNSLHHLAVFGTLVTTSLSTMVRVMATTPIEIIRSQTKTGLNMIETRKDSLNPDTNAMFDVVDAMYTDEDYHNIVDVLTEIQNYPNNTPPADKISEAFIIASILQPFARIQGTAKAKLFLSELDRAVKNQLLIGRRRTNASGKHGKSTVASPTVVRKAMRPKSQKITKAIQRALPTPEIEDSTEVDYTSYVKDPEMMKKLKTKMIIYKQKFQKIRKKEKKMKTKRGPTSTAFITKLVPPMRKSKYYMRKYVKKNLYKMKTTLKKTTYFTWRFHGPYKKFRPLRKFMGTSDDVDTDRLSYRAGSNSDLEIDEQDEDLNRITISMAESNKDSTKNYLPESSISKEVELKANLNDAMYHPNNETIRRRSNVRKVNKIRLDSFSDDEAVLKGNIYKVFGYSNDFAKQLRTLAGGQG
ncbi:unnamed protein product [Danaus chrysippus]|uniref:(African queen) hypothetical protein n=1 Tax=Danaus chrysippus TaxID=151541 RepID=A0A8J2R112_9NEOP|nr:unnamed protein product [Danaus chrysippus]